MEPPDPMDTRDSTSSKRPYSPPSSSSLSGSRRRLQSPPESESVAAAAPIGEDQVVYMFLSLATGPICHSLYALSIPQLGDNNVYPVSELPRPDYPDIMCCKKLGSKLYILGGSIWDNDELCPDFEYPEKVYSIDTSSISPSSYNIDPRTLLVECNSMRSGKPDCFAYVVGSFLYAISPWSDDDDITRFERLDTVSGLWSTLPDPPFNCNIYSDVVVNNKLILGTTNGNVHCFDVKELTWTTIGMCIRGLSFRGHSTMLDDMLYSFTHCTPFAFGPTTDEDIENEVVGLFKKAAIAPMHLSRTIFDHIPMTSSLYLDYWGKRLFCLGIVGSLETEEGTRDSQKGHMSVIIFEVPKQDFEPPTETEEGVPCFHANLLHEARYVFRSCNGAKAGSPYLLGCFSNSTGIV